MYKHPPDPFRLVPSPDSDAVHREASPTFIGPPKDSAAEACKHGVLLCALGYASVQVYMYIQGLNH